MSDAFSMNACESMRILARDGEHAHAGEEGAMEIAMKHVVKSPDNLVIDAGLDGTHGARHSHNGRA